MKRIKINNMVKFEVVKNYSKNTREIIIEGGDDLEVGEIKITND